MLQKVSSACIAMMMASIQQANSLSLNTASTQVNAHQSLMQAMSQTKGRGLKLAVTRVQVPAKSYTRQESHGLIPSKANAVPKRQDESSVAQVSSFGESDTSTDVVSSEEGQVMLDSENTWNYAYTSKLHIGTPPQTIDCLFDTGSANAWILSTDAITPDTRLLHNFYDPEESSTSVVPDDDEMDYVHISFGSGDLEGYFMEDQCLLGDPNNTDNALVLDGMNFGAVTQQTVFTRNFDAIIGLAYPSMASDGQEPLFDTMIREKILDYNLFAFYMSMNPTIENDGSQLTFGYWDESKIEEGETFNWHPVIDQLFWSLKLDDVLVNGTSLGVCDWNESTAVSLEEESSEPYPVDGGRGRKCMFTPDSGTSHLNFPSFALPSLLQATASWNDLPCEYEANLNFGNLTFVIDGIPYDIPSSHWANRYTDESEETGNICHLGVKALDIHQSDQQNLFIIGDEFMQIFYTVFDRDNDQVGFVRAKHEYGELQPIYDDVTGEWTDTQTIS